MKTNDCGIQREGSMSSVLITAHSMVADGWTVYRVTPRSVSLETVDDLPGAIPVRCYVTLEAS